MKKKWESLLNPKRFRDSDINPEDGRTPFENDYARLVFSSSIRRLQDKTQVFPLEKSDFIRSRLTHSMEVSTIARSIGATIEQWLIKNKRLDNKKYKGHISSLLNTAGLVHDLGNPPYGHFGEKAMQSFFTDYFDSKEFKNIESKNNWTKEQKDDFIYFDGNVQTFRILKKLHFLKDEFSFNLTYPLLATIIKYPRSSTEGNFKAKAKNGKISEEKYGYFQSEKKYYEEINSFLKLKNERHPLTFLLEAADDITYSAADIEDGIKLGILSFDDIYEAFDEKVSKKAADEIFELYQEAKNLPFDRLTLLGQRIRIKIQPIMITSVIDTFKENYKEIMNGKFEKPLLESSHAAPYREVFKKLFVKVLNDKNILQKELAGWKVIKGLLKEFIPAAENDFYQYQENKNLKNNSKEARLYKIISTNYRYIYESHSKETENQNYKSFQLVTDFISGMTDNYALELYQKISGIKI